MHSTFIFTVKATSGHKLMVVVDEANESQATDLVKSVVRKRLDALGYTEKGNFAITTVTQLPLGGTAAFFV